jgi:hypothetical protein
VSTYHLDFSHHHSYAYQSAITLPVTLISDVDAYVDLLAKFDTGSTFCIFEKKYADWLGVNLLSGSPAKVATATGSFQTYGHELTLSLFDLEWQAVVYFAEEESFHLNVLGRIGFLDRLRIGLIDYEEMIYLGFYDQK